MTGSLSARRAWIEICWGAAVIAALSGSLSARRAWIEIAGPAVHHPGNAVALRKESVDRNIVVVHENFEPGQSLSARRAWIEILQ